MAVVDVLPTGRYIRAMRQIDPLEVALIQARLTAGATS